MHRGAKASGEWCPPTAELAKPELLSLLQHKAQTDDGDPEVEIVASEDDVLEPTTETTTEPTEPTSETTAERKPRTKADSLLTDPWFDNADSVELEADDPGQQPDVLELSPEEEQAIADAADEPLVAEPNPTGETGEYPAVIHSEPLDRRPAEAAPLPPTPAPPAKQAARPPAVPAARPSAPAVPAARPSAPALPAARPSAPGLPAARPSAPALEAAGVSPAPRQAMDPVVVAPSTAAAVARTLFAIVLVVGAAAGGVLFAMHTVTL